MTEVPLHRGPDETVLPPLPAGLAGALAQTAGLPGEERRRALADLAAAHPREVEVWARLAEVGRDPIETYAYARVGYHRGLDQLRAAGWRGTGYVRARHADNRGFLRALDALQRAAAAIGEQDEAERCALFLRQLDPDWRGALPQ
jgi:hypothetical protein